MALPLRSFISSTQCQETHLSFTNNVPKANETQVPQTKSFVLLEEPRKPHELEHNLYRAQPETQHDDLCHNTALTVQFGVTQFKGVQCDSVCVRMCVRFNLLRNMRSGRTPISGICENLQLTSFPSQNVSFLPFTKLPNVTFFSIKQC